MEKYSRFNDPSNLVNPFAPQSHYPPASLKFFTGPLLLIVRLPLLAVTLPLLALASGTARALACLRPLERLVRRIFEAPLSRLVLLIIGYWSVPSAYAAANKLRLRGVKNSKTRPLPVGSCVRAGDVVVSTATSPVEILWLSWAFSPVFAMVADTTPESAPKDASEDTAGVQLKNMWSALHAFASLQPVPRASSENVTSLRKAADDGAGFAGYPTVAFPEGVRSNGTGVLMFHPIFGDLNFEDKRVHLLAFTHRIHHSSKFSATLPVGSAVKSLLWHCMHWSHSLRVTILPAAELVAPPAKESEAAKKARKDAQVKKEIAARANKGAYGGGIEPTVPMPDPGILGTRCRNLLAKMLGVEALTRCSKDFVPFLEFWLNEQAGKSKNMKARLD